jgi:hypothetical protein
MASCGKGRQVKERELLSIAAKLKIIDRLESRAPVASIVAGYGTGLTTVKDLKRDKDMIKEFCVRIQMGNEKAKSARKTLKMAAYVELGRSCV